MNNVLLLTSHPVAPPWNSGDKNLARTLILGEAGVSYTFIGDRIDPTPWPPHHHRAALNFRSTTPTLREKGRIVRWLALHPPAVDLIHAVITFQGNLLAQRTLLALPALRRRPLLLTCPSGEVLPNEVLRRARATVVLSRRTQRVLQERGVGDVHLIPPGVDLRRFHPEGQEAASGMLGLEPVPSLLFAGHHDPGGGLDAALTLAGLVKRRVPELRLLVAMRARPGENLAALTASMRDRAAARGLRGDDLVELGGIANMRAAILASTAVLFMPAVLGMKMELPMTLLEALACGRPAVISHLAPLDEMLNGSPAVIAGGAEDDAVVAHLERLIRDGDYFTRCSEAARELAEDRYSAEAMVERYAELYSRL